MTPTIRQATGLLPLVLLLSLQLLQLLQLLQPTLATHNQWIDLTVKNRAKVPLHVKVKSSSSGHFYENGDKSITAGWPDFWLKPGESGRVSGTGPAASTDGFTGQLAISRMNGAAEVEVMLVDMYTHPIGDNRFWVRSLKPIFSAAHSPWSKDGTLGEMKLHIFQN